jgi:hypothetical protein
VNGPETALFSKRRQLYGLHLAREGVFRGARLVAVEGYMDVIALHQAGFNGAVAPLGTALTTEQLEALWAVSPEPVLCFDGDAAGARAAARAAEVALPMLTPERTLRLATLPAGEDPDTLIGKQGQGAFEAVLGAQAARRMRLSVGDTFVGAHGLGAGGHAHGDDPYRVTGVLAPTGSVLDRLILTPVESVWDVHGVAHDDTHAATPEQDETHNHDHDHDHAEPPRPAQGALFANRGRIEAPPQEVTLLLIKLRSPLGAESLLRDVNLGPDFLAARPASEAIRLYSLMGLGGRVLQAFAFILIGAAAASVFVTLFATLRERRGEVALLRAMGATQATVFGVLMGQGLAIAAAGTVLGLLGGHALIEILAQNNPQAAAFGLSGMLVHPGEVLIALGGLAAGALAALPAAIGAYRTDIARTLAETG